MSTGGHRATLFVLLAALSWSGPADGSGPPASTSGKPAAGTRPMSSWCLARCHEQEVACKAFENRHPSCSPADICLEEKQQCEAQCRPRVMLPLSTRA